MRINVNGRLVAVPDFFIVGAAKSGTTSLYYYLKQHPDIFLPAIKEPQFFYHKDRPDRRAIHPGTGLPKKTDIEDIDTYLALFSSAQSEQKIGEASTNYLYDHEKVIREIKEFYGRKAKNVKILIVLRNPIDRAWSNYLMHKNTEYENLSFREAIDDSVIAERLACGWPVGYDYVGFGHYENQVNAWKSAFPNTNIFLFEDLITRPLELVKEIFEFLTVDQTIKINVGTKYNMSGRPKNSFAKALTKIIYHPNRIKNIVKKIFPSTGLRYLLRTRLTTILFERVDLPSKERELLVRLYEKEIKELECVIGRSLANWYTT